MALARFDSWVRSVIGPAAAGAQVYVVSQPANTSSVPPSPLVSLFADSVGVTPLAQPLSCDGFGHCDAYLTAGTYTVVVVLSATVQQVYPDQAIGIPAIPVTSVFGRIGDIVASAGDYSAISNLSLGDGSSSIVFSTSSHKVTVTAGAGGLAIVDPAGSVWNAATGGAQGSGTINASGLYVNGVAVSTSTFTGIGINLVAIQNPASNASGLSGNATSCIIARIPAGCLSTLGSKIKVTLTFDASSTGSFILLNSVVRTTDVGGSTFLNTYNLTWGGSTTPTLDTTASKTFTSDASPVAITGLQDVYIILRVSQSTAGTVSCGVWPVTTISHCGGETTGTAYDTTATISSLSTLVSALSAETLLISQVVTS